MEIFDLSSEINSTWDTFFFPIIEFIVTAFVIRYLLSKNMFEKIKNLIIFEKGCYFRKNKGLYVPLPKTYNKLIETTFSNPLYILILFLVLVFALDRLIVFSSAFNPVKFVYNPENLLRYSVDNYTIASLWSYHPNLELYELCNLISQENPTVYNQTQESIHNILIFLQFIELLAIIMFIINIIKDRKMSLRCIGILLVFVILTLVFYLILFYSMTDTMEQNCYSVLNKFQIENELITEDNAMFNECLKKLKSSEKVDVFFSENYVFGFMIKIFDFTVTYRDLVEFIESICYA